MLGHRYLQKSSSRSSSKPWICTSCLLNLILYFPPWTLYKSSLHPTFGTQINKCNVSLLNHQSFFSLSTLLPPNGNRIRYQIREVCIYISYNYINIKLMKIFEIYDAHIRSLVLRKDRGMLLNKTPANDFFVLTSGVWQIIF